MDIPLLSLLLVDNSQEGYHLIQNLLAKSERGLFKLDWAKSYFAALEAIERCSYDLYLVEHKLGQFSGLDLLAELKNRTCDVPVILLSHRYDASLDNQAIQAGIADYLAKDWLTPPLLERSIRHAVERKRIDKERARLLEAEREQRQIAEMLRDVSLNLSATLDLNAVLDRLLEHVSLLAPYDSANVMLVEGEYARIIRWRGYEKFGDEATKAVENVRFDLHTTANLRHIVETGEPFIIPDTAVFPGWVKIKETSHIRSWIGIPLIAKGKTIGFFALDKIEPDFHRPHHAERLKLLATQAALAIENAQLFEAEARRRREAEMLREATVALTTDLDLKQILDKLLVYLEKVIPYNNATVFLVEEYENQLRVVAARHHPKKDAIINQTFTLDNEQLFTEMRRTGRPLFLPDAQADPRFLAWGGTIYTRGWMGAPLIARDKIIGYLSIDSRQVNAYSEKEVSLAQAFANQAAIAVENARLFEKTRQHLILLDAVREASLSLTSSLDLQTVLDTILENALKLITKAYNANIFLYQNERLSFGAARYVDGAQGKPFAEPRPQGLTYTVARTGRLIMVPDMQDHPLFENTPAHWTGSIVGIPLKIGRRIVGVMNIACQQPRVWPEHELHYLQLMAEQAAVAIENARLYEQVQQYTAELQERVAERTYELQVLYELSQALGHASRQSDVLRLTLLHLYQVLHYDVAVSLLVAEHRARFVVQSQHPLSAELETDLQDIMLCALEHLGGASITRTALEVHHIQPREEPNDAPPIDHLNSLAQVALVFDGVPSGLLLIGQKETEQLDANQARFVQIAADQAVESLQRLQSLLADEYRRLESLVAHLPNGLVVLDAEQNVVMANPLGQEFLALAGQVAVGGKLTHLGQYTIDAILNADTGNSPLEITLKGPPEYLLQVTARSIEVGPEAGGWLLLIRNITQERMIQKQIQQQEQLAAVGQLAAGIAHDFNNILTSIIGYAELLQMDPAIPESARHDLSRITQQAQRAAYLVRQILDFSRQSLSEKQPLELAPFIKETAKLLERTIPENIQIQVQIDPYPQGYQVHADLPQMQQVLTNLAVNARDAMPDGGVLQFHLFPFRLEPDEYPPCADMPPGDWIGLSISDTGVGIPPDHLPHIFEPFFTTKEIGKGTGLGLAQTYGIITQHEGFIQVNSKPGQGTTFALYLPPLLPDAEPAHPADKPAMIPGNNELILVVEDNPSVLEVTQTMLEHLGYRVLVATNGQEALTIYEQRQSEIALILTDITMPDMGGIEMAQAISAKNPNVRIIALTGYPLDNEQDIKTWRTYGIIAWIQKPLSLEQLAHTISNALIR